MRTIISNELIKVNINHVYSEYEKEKKIFFYVKDEDREKAEKIMNILGNFVEFKPSFTEYKIMNWTVIIKRKTW